jgi:hypothetical protein
MIARDPIHLGDGAYVEFDGWQFVLKANSVEEPTDTVYLELDAMQGLLNYVRSAGVVLK